MGRVTRVARFAVIGATCFFVFGRKVLQKIIEKLKKNIRWAWEIEERCENRWRQSVKCCSITITFNEERCYRMAALNGCLYRAVLVHHLVATATSSWSVLWTSTSTNAAPRGWVSTMRRSINQSINQWFIEYCSMKCWIKHHSKMTQYKTRL